MSISVDKRVVEMVFKNERFEEKIRDTLGSLGRLKESLRLKGASKGFDDITNAARNVDLSPLEAAVSNIEARFSSFGIVGMTVLQNLTNSVVNLGKSLVSQIAHGGITRAMNIQQARFQIAGLEGDWETLKENINYAVKDTAYGFDEAAKAAAMFTASGIKAGDQMASYLRGVSGAAAMTGSSYEEIANIFATVAGNGKLMGDQLQQFASRGLNAAAALAKAWNTTEEEVRAIIKDKDAKITFEEFASAMDKVFGPHSKEAGKTFQGAFANVKAALSRIGEAFVTPLIQNKEEVENVEDEYFNLVDILNSVKAVFNSWEAKLRESTFLQKYIELVSKLSRAISTFFYALSGAENGWENFQKATNMSDMTLQNLKDTIDGFAAIGELFQLVIVEFAKAIAPTNEAIGSFGGLIVAITGAVGRGVRTFVDWIKSTKVLQKTFKGFGTIVKGISTAIRVINTAISTLITLVSTYGNGLFQKFLDGITKAVTTLGDAVKWLRDQTYNNLTKYILPAFGKFGDSLANGMTRIHEVLQSNDEYTSKVEAVTEIFKSGKESAKGYFNTVKQFFTKIKDSKEVTALTDSFKKLSNAISELFAKALAFLIKKVKETYKLLDDLGVFKQIAKFFTDAATGLTDFITKVTSALDPIEKLKEGLDPENLKEFAKNAKDAATNIDGLGTATKIFSYTVDGLKQMIQYFKDLKANMSGNSEVTGKLKEFFGGLEGASGGIDIDKLIDRSWGVTKIVAALQSLRIIDRVTKKYMPAILGLPKNISSFFGNMAKAAKAAKKNQMAAAIRNIAIGVAAIAASIYLLTKVDVKKLPQALAIVGGVMAALIFLLKKTSGASPYNLSTLQALSVTFVSLGASMLFLSIAAKSFASLKPAELIKAGAAIVAFSISMNLAANLAKSKFKNGAGLLAMALAANLLVPAIIAMSKMKFETLIKGGGAIVAFTLAMALAAKAAPKESLWGLLGIAAAVTALVPAIVVLSILPLAKALKSAVILSGLIVALGAAARIAKTEMGNKSFATFILIGAMVASMTGSLVILSTIDFFKLLKAVSALTATMIGLGIAAQIAATEGKNIGRMALMMGLVTGVLYLMAAVPTDQVVSNMVALSAMLLSVAGVVALFDKIFRNATWGALKGITIGLAAFAEVIGVLIGIVSLLGALNRLEGFNELFGRGKSLLIQVGQTIGGFIGGIVDGFGQIATSSLSKMAADIYDFFAIITPALSQLSSIDPSIGKTIKNISKAFLDLTAGDFLNNITGAFFGSNSTTSFTSFINGMQDLAAGYVSFSNSVKDVPPEQIKRTNSVVRSLSKFIAACSEMPSTTDSIKSMFVGRGKLTDFAKGLGNFAKEFKTNVLPNLGDISEEQAANVSRIASVLSKFINAANSLPPLRTKEGNANNLKAFVEGEKDIEEFGTSLGNFSSTFKNEVVPYLTEITDAQVESLLKVAKIITKLAEAANELPPSTEGISVKQFFTGDQSLANFGIQLASFAGTFSEAMAGFPDNIGESEQVKIEAISGICISLATMAKKIKGYDDGKLGFPKDTLIKLASDMTEFAPKFKEFAEAAFGIEEEQIQRATKVARAAQAMGEAAKVIDLVPIQDRVEKLTTLAAAFKKFAEDMTDFTVSDDTVAAAEKAAALAKAAVDALNSASGNFKKPGQNSGKAYIKGIAETSTTSVSN